MASAVTIHRPRARGDRWRTFLPLLPTLLLFLLLGCAADEKSDGRKAATQPASRDPYTYQPHFDEKPNISGGDIGHFDKKAWKHDWNSLMNP